MSEKYLVLSGKGGVGKSSVCACLGTAFSRRGHSVRILGGDCGFRCQDLLFGLENSALYDFSDILENRCLPKQAILPTGFPGVDLLCAPLDPFYLPEPDTLKRLVHWAGQHYSCVLVDCAAGFGGINRLLSADCTEALVITTPDDAAVRSAGQISRLLTGNGLSRQRLIINRIPAHFSGSGSIRDLDDVIDRTGIRLIGAIPDGKPLFPPGPVQRLQPAHRELERIAARLDGSPSPLVLFH